MYMYYIIRYLLDERGGGSSQKSYILATDADIKFTAQDVTALLMMLARDKQVGAVCGRTYPIGSGPLVWYQIFDYAIGHWFQKAAEHVLGSVLCCPGCFSMYRIDALREVVTTYSTNVNKPFEFLTKDMGEDRWLCTLLVIRGWRLDYCAVAKDSTYCPENFKEFYNQRRRWIVSTLANMIEVIQHGREAVRRNESVSWLYIFYQMLMLVSTVMSPATVLLVMIGGFSYILKFNLVAAYVIMFTVALFYLLVCLYLNQDKQILIAKLLTGIFALIMALVFIGLMAQVTDNIHTALKPPAPPTTTTTTTTTTHHNHSHLLYTTASSVMGGNVPVRERRDVNSTLFDAASWQENADDGWAANATAASDVLSNLVKDVRGVYFQLAALAAGGSEAHAPHIGGRPDEISLSTIYLMVMIAMFLLAGMLHLGEFMALIHGVWYLLCLPSGYLFLLLYSCCNLDDRSWGTRVAAAARAATARGEVVVMEENTPWYRSLLLGCGLRANERLSHFIGRILCCQYWREDSQIIPPPPPEEEPEPTQPPQWRVRRVVGDDGQPVHVVECIPVQELATVLRLRERTVEGIETLFKRALLSFPELASRAQRHGAGWCHSVSVELQQVRGDYLQRLVVEDAEAAAVADDLERSSNEMSDDFCRFLNERRSLLQRTSVGPAEADHTPLTLPVEIWLRRHELYDAELAARLRHFGFETAALIGHMADEDIIAMAIGDMRNGYVMEEALRAAVDKQRRERAPESPSTNVNQWLTKLGMGEYIYHFEWFGLADVSMTMLARVSREQLDQMGVDKIGHVRQLLAGIETLRTQLEAEKAKQERNTDESISIPKKLWSELTSVTLETLDQTESRRHPEERKYEGKHCADTFWFALRFLLCRGFLTSTPACPPHSLLGRVS
jgi:hypothetical protein